ncbi:hypothetical protein [Streptomyces sp. NPDC017949]|uniref:hypothetical protein n=1 Tax=Streptomyces sp. NPDC017949 TaxID=3365020 RepID=UPI0037A83593
MAPDGRMRRRLRPAQPAAGAAALLRCMVTRVGEGARGERVPVAGGLLRGAAGLLLRVRIAVPRRLLGLLGLLRVRVSLAGLLGVRVVLVLRDRALLRWWSGHDGPLEEVGSVTGSATWAP